MVVIAGSGHIAYGSGIPKRVHRLNGKQYVTIVNAKSGTPLTGLADFVLFPETLQPVIPPKLGILIEKTDRKGVEIKGVTHGGVAWKAGMEKGDMLLSMDGKEINDVDDVHITLFDKKAGDNFEATVLRKRFLLRDKKRTLRIQIP